VFSSQNIYKFLNRDAFTTLEKLPTRLGSQSHLPWSLTPSINYLSFWTGLDSAFLALTYPPFWNGKPRVSLISGLTYSDFWLNLLSETGPRSRKLVLMPKAEIYWNPPRWPQGDWNYNLKPNANLEQLHTNTERNEMCSLSFGCETSCIFNPPESNITG